MANNDEREAPDAQARRGWSDLFTSAGAIAGTVALLWNVGWTISNARSRYVQLALTVQPATATTATVLTTIENQGEFSNTIDYAALVISPFRTDVKSVVQELRRCTNTEGAINVSAEPPDTVLAYLPSNDDPVYCDGAISLIPLTFFYREQRRIGNEKLSSRTLIDLDAFHQARGATRAYDVRFVVRGQGRLRTTLDLLLVQPAAIAK